MSAAVAAVKKQPIQISDVGSRMIVPPVDEIADTVLDVTDSAHIDQYVVVSCFCLSFATV